MRYDSEHKQRTREKVLKAAAKAIRARGSASRRRRRRDEQSRFDARRVLRALRFEGRARCGCDRTHVRREPLDVGSDHARKITGRSAR